MVLIERSSPTSQQKKSQHAIPNHMPGLAKIVMEDEKFININLAEKVRQQRIEHATGILRREEIRGLKCNESDPNHGWPPRAQRIGMRRSQSFSSLFGRVVRRLARDHDIMHMAFSKTGGADSHEARLLLQISDGLATTITHARSQTANHLVNDH